MLKQNLNKYPIRNTTGGVNHGQIVSGKFTYNPIPEDTECTIIFKNMKVQVRVDMHFYTNPNLSIFEILKVDYDK